jgi:transcriptional regulator with XRE-family HTH domain
MTFAKRETSRVRGTLGTLLRRRREAAERSLADVATAAGISIAHLSEVERGRKDISTDRLVAVARALDTTAGDLYTELGRELGGGEPGRGELLSSVAWESDPRAQLRRMSEALDPDALRTVARFTTFLALTEAAPRRRPIGFLR